MSLMVKNINKFPDIRIILGPPRSGTTALQNALCEAKNSLGLYEPIRAERLMDNCTLATFKYRAFLDYDNPDLLDVMQRNKGKLFILKDGLGKTLSKWAKKIFLEHDDIVERGKPLFIFRNPVYTFNSFKKLNWHQTADDFVKENKMVIDVFNKLKDKHPDDVEVTTEEKLSSNPKKVLKNICNFWGIDYTDNMVNWKKDINDKIYFFVKHEEKFVRPKEDVSKIEDLHYRLFDKNCGTFVNTAPKIDELIISKDDITTINDALSEDYKHINEIQL